MICNRCHTELEYIFQELWFCSTCKECLGESEDLQPPQFEITVTEPDS